MGADHPQFRQSCHPLNASYLSSRGRQAPLSARLRPRRLRDNRRPFGEAPIARRPRIRLLQAQPALLGATHRVARCFNPVSNAIKFTEKGSIRIEGREKRRTDGPAVLAFSVIDTGIGIDTAQQAELFQPFSQVDRSSTRKFHGTGLGLSIIRSLAEQMGGEAGVSSALGQGAHFWFEVLAERVAADEGSRQRERNLPAGGPAEGPARKRADRRRQPDQPPRHQTICASTACRSIAAKKANWPCAPLPTRSAPTDPDDCQMPVMDGFQATREYAVEQANGRPPVRIIALTAAAYDEDRQLCLAAGMNDFLAKPIDVKVMLRALSTAPRP